VVSGFQRHVDELCAVLGYDAASCDRRFGTTYPSHLQGSTVGDGTDTLSRNVGKQLPHDAASYPRKAQMSGTIILNRAKV
jgi:hypothetical protein